MRLQVESNHYYSKYDTKGRFCSYWHQIQEIMLLKPQKVLEIGIGNSFVSKYLKERKLNITTTDIDGRLNPDIVSTILKLPFIDEFFDLVVCYEVLEHLPYNKFNKAISEIYRVSKSHAILSLPDANRVYRFNIQIPKVGEIKKLIPSPIRRTSIHSFDGEHYWEIGKSSYPIKKIIDDIERIGFNIERTYRVFEMPSHRFFILKKLRNRVCVRVDIGGLFSGWILGGISCGAFWRPF